MAELEASEPMQWKPVCIVRTREGEVICQWWWIFEGEEILLGWRRIRGIDGYDRALAERKTTEEFVSEHLPRPF